jgi:hypothetical protein
MKQEKTRIRTRQMQTRFYCKEETKQGYVPKTGVE